MQMPNLRAAGRVALSVLRHVARAALLALSVLATLAVIVVPPIVSWRLARADQDPTTRLRTYLVTTADIPKGTALRDEHVTNRVGRIAAQDPIAHRSEAVGRYAKAAIAANSPLTRGLVSAVADATATSDSVLVVVEVKRFYATHLSVGMRLGFARATVEDGDETENGEQSDQKPPPAQGPAPDPNAGERSNATPRPSVVGLDGGGYELVALSTSGDGDNAVAVLEVRLPRDEDIIRALAVGEWHPVVLAPAATAAAGGD
jgi:hypothetical protein